MLKKQHKTVLQDEINQLLPVVQLEGHPGFIFLLNHFDEVKKTIKDALVEELNQSEVVRLQERFKAFNSMLEAAKAYIDSYKLRLQELQDIETDQQFKDEFAIER